MFNEIQAYYGAPRDLYGTRMIGPTVLMFGTEEQKKRLLPPIISGEVQ